LTTPEGKAIDQAILNGGIKGSIKQTGQYLSEKLLIEYKLSLKFPEIIRSAKVRYQTAVESMGKTGRISCWNP